MDADGDGHGGSDTIEACTMPPGYAATSDDCDDDDDASHPTADEVCDDTDNDCDEAVDEDAVDAPTWYADDDDDGFTSEVSVTDCLPPSGYSAASGLVDCDDADPSIHPAAEDVPGDGIDQDCDGLDASRADTGDSGLDEGPPPLPSRCSGCAGQGSAVGIFLFPLLAVARRRA
ncbi:MAG: hypothetical protein GY913_00025 [Proteobacteria bacterium]|nr:hypothetical protein [Pseudomonadota bacterium]